MEDTVMTGHEKIAARNIKAAFNYIVGGYYNSLQDGDEDYLPDTLKELEDEIYESSMTDLFREGYMECGKAPKEMKFAGTEFCRNYIRALLKDDGDVAEIAEVKGWNNKEEKTMMKAIERKTGVEVAVERTEEGRFKVAEKTYAASTFKKYFKVTGETVAAPKAQTVEVELYTFTNMKIQGIFTATLVNGEYQIDTKKKGILTFNADTMIQTK